MRGPEAVATVLTARLAVAIPARLRVAETRLGLPVGALPNPQRLVDYDAGPIPLESWPAVYVLPQRMTRLTLIENTLDGEHYRARYPVRVLAWVRADGYQPTDLLRKRYALAIREALLDRRALAGGATEREVAVDPTTITEDYSEVMVDAGRTIAGTWLDVDVTAVEVLDPPTALGVVNTKTVTAVAKHPALGG